MRMADIININQADNLMNISHLKEFHIHSNSNTYGLKSKLDCIDFLDPIFRRIAADELQNQKTMIFEYILHVAQIKKYLKTNLDLCG